MRIGILTGSFNFDEAMKDGKQVRDVRDSLQRRGHEVLHLDTAQARSKGADIVYPNLSEHEKLDAFIGYYSEDPSIPYFDQLKYLSDKFPSPVPYAAQIAARDKTALIGVFSSAGVPFPVSYDGNDMDARNKALDDIANGKTIVFKPDFGGSGHGIIKTDTIEDALNAFRAFDAEKTPFMMQHYIEQSGADYRAYVVGNDVIGGIKRTAQTPGEWRTNVALGSSVEAHALSDIQKTDAIKAVHAAGLRIGAADILVDPKTNQHYICEVNDACSGAGSIESTHPGVIVAEKISDMLEREYGSDRKGSKPTPQSSAKTDLNLKR